MTEGPSDATTERSLVRLLLVVPMHITFEAFQNPAANTRSYPKKDGRTYHLPPTDLPLGMLAISAYLKKHANVEVRLVDLNVRVAEIDRFDHDSFRDFVADELAGSDFRPDVVGVSCLFSTAFGNFLETARAVRKVFPAALVVGGGNVPSAAYADVLGGPDAELFDALCFGEGELPMLELVRANDRGAYLAEALAWVTREKLARGFVPRHQFIQDLDEIPFLDYDLCDVDKHGVNPVVTSFATSRKVRSFHVMTSRGCPFLCTFCASHAVHGRQMRYYGLDRLREDFTRLKRDYGAGKLVFQDDHLMASKERVLAILGLLRELELESVYQSGLALYALDRPILEAFHAAGVRQLVLSVESGSQRVLKSVMRKPLKLEISQRVARDCRELGIYTNTSVLIGLPGETKEDIEDARRNLRTIPTNWFHINCASPLVGSEIHAIAREAGYIRGETLGADFKVAAIETPEFSREYIQEMQYLLNLELNFVHNHDMRLGEYQTALLGFENVLRIKPDHAFAWYYAGKCHEHLGHGEQAAECARRWVEHSRSDFWRPWVSRFGLPSDGRGRVA